MIADELVSLMQGHFGSEGPTRLQEEMESAGVEDLENMEEQQKLDLIDGIIENSFTGVMSPTKMRMINAQLYGILGCEMY